MNALGISRPEMLGEAIVIEPDGDQSRGVKGNLFDPRPLFPLTPRD